MTAPQPRPHERKVAPSAGDDEEEDPVDAMIARTGCAASHYAVQECMAATRDWRRCQPQVAALRDCMREHQRRAAPETPRP
ncbi:cytochrome c oxidase assembly factor 4 homolog, mitochondrial [Lethenteron reissneri]|uniref:cytochrome c oxidase assembly factor 4 homolog, mitochondrial n=1 Tax=Lethenteron reissneri TaxID=7753 RepID=UPI002AB7B31A|nr:cytochrome c oxidase assembly factor 4 homolog, mitochondrial [Lethenteron reissneri]